MLDNDYVRNYATAIGYADMEGWAATLSNGFADLTPEPERIQFIQATLGVPIMETNAALKCMALYWFYEGGAELASGRLENALDFIHEAYTALQSVTINEVWNDAFMDGQKDLTESGSKVDFAELGRTGAMKRHAKLTQLRQWTVDRYRAGSAWSSANQAAHALLPAVLDQARIIGASITAQNAQRTIAEWLRKSV